jgi:hypothetical protein
MDDYELELENTIRRLIALMDAAREGSAEYRMIVRQLIGVRDSSELRGLIIEEYARRVRGIRNQLAPGAPT